MKSKLNYSGAGEEYKYVREHYCDEEGNLSYERIREAMIKEGGGPGIPHDEFMRILREGPNGERKKKDNNNDKPA